MCAYCPDSRHVPYYIIHCQWLKLNVDFRGESVQWSQTPSPLAYAVYAFINVDNCERPLNLLLFDRDHERVATRRADCPVASSLTSLQARSAANSIRDTSIRSAEFLIAGVRWRKARKFSTVELCSTLRRATLSGARWRALMPACRVGSIYRQVRC